MLQPSFSVNFLKFVINNFCQRWWSFVSSQIQMTVCLKWIVHPKWKICQHLLPYFDPKSWDWTLQDLIVSCISHDLTFMTSSCKSRHCNCVDYFNGTASFAGHHKHTGCIIKWITKVLTISRTLPCCHWLDKKTHLKFAPLVELIEQRMLLCFVLKKTGQYWFAKKI